MTGITVAMYESQYGIKVALPYLDPTQALARGNLMSEKAQHTNEMWQ